MASLERPSLTIKDKKSIKRRGRPVFVYSSPPEIKHKVALTITITKPPNNNRQLAVFKRSRYPCRFKRSEYYKKTKRKCEA